MPASGYHDDLRDLVERNSPHAVPKVEAIVTEAEDIRSFGDEWGSPTPTNAVVRPDGSLRLTFTNLDVFDSTDASGGGQDNYDFTQNVTNTLFDGSTGQPTTVFLWGFASSVSDHRRLTQIQTDVNVTGNGRVIIRAYTIKLEDPDYQDGQWRGAYRIREVADPHIETPDAGVQTVKMDLSNDGLPLRVGQLDIARNANNMQLFSDPNDQERWRNLLIVVEHPDTASLGDDIWVEGDDRQLVSNSDGSGKTYFVDINQPVITSSVSGTPDRVNVKLQRAQYSSQSQFQLSLDLGSAPSDTVEFIKIAQIPAGADVTTEVRNDADSAWVEYEDGDTTDDLAGVSDQQTYTIRVTIDSDSNQEATPVVRSVGAKARKLIDVSPYILEANAMREVDPFKCQAEVAEMQLKLTRDGIRDFRDRVTDVATGYTFQDIQFRFMLGSDLLPRSKWLHLGVWDIDDRNPIAGGETFTLVSPLQRLKVQIPKQVDVGGGVFETEPVDYSGSAINTVVRDIIVNQVGVATRFTGTSAAADGFCGFPSDSLGGNDTVTRRLTSSDGKKAVDELARLVGYVLTMGKHGKYRFADLYGPKAPVAHFAKEEVAEPETPVGLRARVPEFFVPYSWDEDDNEFDGQTRGYNQAAFNEYGLANIDAVKTLDKDTAKWIDELGGSSTPPDRSNYSVATSAQRVAYNAVRHFGAGHIQWRFKSVVPRPHLEIGDMVTVEVDTFTGRHFASGAQLLGTLTAKAVIVGMDVWGTRFTVWVRHWDDISLAHDDGDLFVSPRLLSSSAFIRENGDLEVSVQGNAHTRSVKVALDASDYPAKGNGTAYNLDGNDRLVAQVVESAMSPGEVRYITITPYSSAGGTGVAGAVHRMRREAIIGIRIKASRHWQRGNKLFIMVSYVGGSFKWATSTSSQPSAGTGTTVNTDTAAIVDLGNYAYGDTVYVTLTPYENDGAGGEQGEARELQLQMTYEEGQFDEPTGKRKRDALLEDDKLLIPVDEIKPGAEDIILNGDFEDGWTWWGKAAGGTVSLETASPYKGTNSVKLTQPGDSSNRPVVYQMDNTNSANPDNTNKMLIRVEPGDILRFKAAGKVDDASQPLNLKVQEWDEAKSNNGFVEVLSWTELTFTEKEAKHIVGSGSYYVTVHFVVKAGGTSSSAWIDEVHVWRAKQAPDIDDALFSDTGDLDDGVRVDPGGGETLPIFRHPSEQVVQDNSGSASVNFATGYQEAPLVTVVPHQLISFNASLGTSSDQALRVKPVNVDTQGFDAEAKNVQPGTTTPQTANFPEDDHITTQGGSSTATIGGTAANDDAYEVHFDVEVEAIADPGQSMKRDITVVVESDDGGGAVERWSKQYSAQAIGGSTQTNTFTNEIANISVSGLANGDIIVKVKTVTDTGKGSASHDVHPYEKDGNAPDDSTEGVHYTTATDTTESAMPDGGGHGLRYIAQETS